MQFKYEYTWFLILDYTLIAFYGRYVCAMCEFFLKFQLFFLIVYENIFLIERESIDLVSSLLHTQTIP